MPNALLKRFFAEYEPFRKLDFEKLPETKPDELLKAWEAVPDSEQRKLEPKLRQIFDMSCQKGSIAISDEAKWRINNAKERDALIERLAQMKSHYERAMTVYLDHPEFWKAATRFYRADSMTNWKVRRGLPQKAASQDHGDRRAFEAEIGGWFRKHQARGKNCQVEVYRRDDRDYFFAYPEDFADELSEYVDNKLDRKPHRPAFEVVFVWKEKDGTLEINCRGTKKVLEAMQAGFARCILKLPTIPPVPAKPVYDLDRLKDRNFPFVYDPGQGIEAVWVNRLRLESITREGDRVTFEAETDADRYALYDLIKRVNMAIPLDRWQVWQASLSARLAGTGEKPAWVERFNVTSPNSTNLKHDEVGVKLRAMLAASGIEVK
jgi:hypothetical protein